MPRFADGFVRSEPFEGLEPATEVVGGDEVAEVLPELVMAVVMVALDGRATMVRFIRSTWPLVQGCLGLVSRCSMSFWAQASSNEWARNRSPLVIARLVIGTAEPPAPGVVKWMP